MINKENFDLNLWEFIPFVKDMDTLYTQNSNLLDYSDINIVYEHFKYIRDRFIEIILDVQDMYPESNCSTEMDALVLVLRDFKKYDIDNQKALALMCLDISNKTREVFLSLAKGGTKGE